jgi:hypothetical protein
MNRALPILSLCLALLALAFAAVPRDPIVVSSAPEPEVRRGVDVEAELLNRRLEVLEDENRALWDRVVLLERRAQAGGAAVTDGGLATPASVVQEVAQLKRELRSVIAGEVLSDESSRAALKEVIREAEADAQRERFAQRQQREAQRAQEQKAKWKDFVSSAKLTYAQEQELNRRLEAEEAARVAFAQQLQSGQPFDPQAMRALRDQRRETDRTMSGLLNATQKTQYDELRREDRGGNRQGGERRERTAQPR